MTSRGHPAQFSTDVPSTVEPSRKVTEPDGVGGPATVAVRWRTGRTVVGLGDTFRPSVVPVGLTVWVKVDERLEAKMLSPPVGGQHRVSPTRSA